MSPAGRRSAGGPIAAAWVMAAVWAVGAVGGVQGAEVAPPSNPAGDVRQAQAVGEAGTADGSPAAAQAGIGAAAPLAPRRAEVWINPGLYSRHFDRDLGLRENNWGFGVEWLPDPHHGVMVGQYHNSNDRLTRYITYVWRPWIWDWGGSGDPDRPRLRTSLGLVIGAFNGYPTMREGGWFLGGLPVLGLEYGRLGVNASVVPGYKDRLHGALALQLRLRVW